MLEDAAAMKRISSRHHPLVARCRALARGRTDAPRLLLDGLHLVADAARAGLSIEVVAFSARALAGGEASLLAERLAADGVEVVEAADTVMEALSPVSTPSGVVGIAHCPPTSLDAVLARSPQLVVVAVDVQDPGNAGAIVRAAEAGGATGVVFCGASADPFGWKALRGSMGSALRLPLGFGIELSGAVEGVRRAGLRVAATLPRGGRAPDGVDLRQPVALLLGGEGPGLPADVVAAADDRVTIPMQPPVESLNVAVAAALLVYEAARQRRGGGAHP
ncbi:MAG: RNA methyltransferase [Acidobacteria bacterium]|nr:MAG: RNA methyltransferase [Acidobacteriota bacterium]